MFNYLNANLHNSHRDLWEFNQIYINDHDSKVGRNRENHTPDPQEIIILKEY